MLDRGPTNTELIGIDSAGVAVAARNPTMVGISQCVGLLTEQTEVLLIASSISGSPPA